MSWNCADVLASCLAALPAALDDLDAEVVVVDNASSDSSADVAARARVTLVRAKGNLGYARGMNLALSGPPVEVLVALNPDTIPGPGSIARLVADLLARPDVGLVAPLLVHADGSVQHSVHRFPTLGLAVVANLVPAALLPSDVRDRLWLPGAVRPERSGPIDWAIGAVHVMRAGAVGDRPYDERWFMYVEDVDLCHRLRRTGWRVWFSGDVTVVHHGHVSAGQAFGGQRAARWLNETYDWYARRHGAIAVRLYALVNLLGVLVRLGAWAARAGWRPQRRARVRAARRLVVVHARVVLAGPPPPAAEPLPATIAPEVGSRPSRRGA